MKNLKKKSGIALGGFTLIELLVVMAIIAMLSVLAVNGYMSYRKHTLLDLAADNLVAQINEMRSRTIHGAIGAGRIEEVRAELGGVAADGGVAVDSVEAEAAVKCFGVYFEVVGGQYVARFFDQKFQNKKVWDPVKKWHYQGCEDFDKASFGIGLEMEEEIKIVGLSKDESKVESLILRFVPIDGTAEISLDKGQLFDQDFEPGETLKIMIRYGNDTDPKFQRVINFDLR